MSERLPPTSRLPYHLAAARESQPSLPRTKPRLDRCKICFRQVLSAQRGASSQFLSTRVRNQQKSNAPFGLGTQQCGPVLVERIVASKGSSPLVASDQLTPETTHLKLAPASLSRSEGSLNPLRVTSCRTERAEGVASSIFEADLIERSIELPPDLALIDESSASAALGVARALSFSLEASAQSPAGSDSSLSHKAFDLRDLETWSGSRESRASFWLETFAQCRAFFELRRLPDGSLQVLVELDKASDFRSLEQEFVAALIGLGEHQPRVEVRQAEFRRN